MPEAFVKRYMMATEAHHVLGDLSRPTPGLVIVRDETETDYLGEPAEDIDRVQRRSSQINMAYVVSFREPEERIDG